MENLFHFETLTAISLLLVFATFLIKNFKLFRFSWLASISVFIFSDFFLQLLQNQKYPFSDLDKTGIFSKYSFHFPFLFFCFLGAFFIFKNSKRIKENLNINRQNNSDQNKIKQYKIGKLIYSLITIFTIQILYSDKWTQYLFFIEILLVLNVISLWWWNNSNINKNINFKFSFQHFLSRIFIVSILILIGLNNHLDNIFALKFQNSTYLIAFIACIALLANLFPQKNSYIEAQTKNHFYTSFIFMHILAFLFIYTPLQSLYLSYSMSLTKHTFQISNFNLFNIYTYSFIALFIFNFLYVFICIFKRKRISKNYFLNLISKLNLLLFLIYLFCNKTPFSYEGVEIIFNYYFVICSAILIQYFHFSNNKISKFFTLLLPTLHVVGIVYHLTHINEFYPSSILLAANISVFLLLCYHTFICLKPLSQQQNLSIVENAYILNPMHVFLNSLMARVLSFWTNDSSLIKEEHIEVSTKATFTPPALVSFLHMKSSVFYIFFVFLFLFLSTVFFSSCANKSKQTIQNPSSKQNIVSKESSSAQSIIKPKSKNAKDKLNTQKQSNKEIASLQSYVKNKLNSNFSKNSEIDILYMTNRDLINPAKKCGQKTFSSTYSDKMNYGSCKVHIPQNHFVGDITVSSNSRPKMDDEYVFVDHTIFDLPDIIKKLSNNDTPSLVFIHGFNVSFDSAVLRAAQLAYDLKYTGKVLLISWPAGTESASYLLHRTYGNNKKNAKKSEIFIHQFLNILVNAKHKANIIIHSMGHQVFIPAMASYVKNYHIKNNTKLFNQAMFHAPDISHKKAKKLIEFIAPYFERVSVYCSQYDRALVASSYFNSNTRLGQCKKLEHTDVINVSKLHKQLQSFDYLGHSYYASRSIVGDMFQALLGIPAANRLFIQLSQKYAPEDFHLRP